MAGTNQKSFGRRYYYCSAVPPADRRSHSAAPAAPYVPPSDVLPAVCCRRAALPLTLTVPRRLYTHTLTTKQQLSLSHLTFCSTEFALTDERTEPPGAPQRLRWARRSAREVGGLASLGTLKKLGDMSWAHVAHACTLKKGFRAKVFARFRESRIPVGAGGRFVHYIMCI